MYNLPFELHIEISHLLSLQSISSLAKTCVELNTLYSASLFWQRLLNKEYSKQEQMEMLKSTNITKITTSIYPDVARYYEREAQEIHNSIFNKLNSFVNLAVPTALSIPSYIDPKKLYRSSELWKLKLKDETFTFKKQFPIFVQQISIKYRIGCLIDMNDFLWSYTEKLSENNQEICCWENTQRYAKFAVTGSYFIIFIGSNDYVYYYFPHIKRFLPLISHSQKHIQAKAITISREISGLNRVFAVATFDEQVLLYSIPDPLPKYVFNISVHSIDFNTSHLIFIDLSAQVSIFRWSNLGLSNVRNSKLINGIREITPTPIIHLTAKSVNTNSEMLNAIIIGLDQVVRKLILSGNTIQVQEISSISRLGKFIHPCSLVDKTPNKIMLRHDPSIPLAKANNAYFSGWKELKASAVCVGHDFCWLTDLNGELWCFSKNMAGGTKFPVSNFRIKQISGDLLMRSR